MWLTIFLLSIRVASFSCSSGNTRQSNSNPCTNTYTQTNTYANSYAQANAHANPDS